ncbi:hypothetical protein [Commensalibacter sp. Nvir]
MLEPSQASKRGLRGIPFLNIYLLDDQRLSSLFCKRFYPSCWDENIMPV